MGRTSSTVKDRYNAKVYDEIKVRVSKGKKDIIQANAEAQGQSINAYINTAIDEKMSREATGSRTRPTASKIISGTTDGGNGALGPSGGRTEGIADEG